MNTITNTVTTVTNIVTMSDKEWPSEIPFCKAFALGLLAWLLFYGVVWLLVKFLHWRGGTKIGESAAVKKIALSPYIAFFEQLLFYLAAIVGPEVFGWAVGGWLVFKSVSRYARWQSSDVPAKPQRNTSSDEEKARVEDARAHNRFQIFIVGTGMSIAAGGIAGVVYHYALDRGWW